MGGREATAADHGADRNSGPRTDRSACSACRKPAFPSIYHLNAPTIQRYVDLGNGIFTGPESTRLNGGQPVPFQWLDAQRQTLLPNASGAEIDYGHPGICSMIVSYCGDPILKPTELDFAWLDDIGLDLISAPEAAEPELYGYGACATYSAWGVGVERVLD